MNTKERFWKIAERAAYQVEFLSNAMELFLYAKAIYSAMLWGWGKKAEEIEKETSTREKLF